MRTNPDTQEIVAGCAVEEMPPTVITCPASLDIAGVQDVYKNLHAALEAHHPIVLDGAQVERADTAALQLLCAFAQEARARGIPWQWQEVSPALQEAARLLDLCAPLELPQGHV